jgi:hypothetical protein
VVTSPSDLCFGGVISSCFYVELLTLGRRAFVVRYFQVAVLLFFFGGRGGRFLSLEVCSPPEFLSVPVEYPCCLAPVEKLF